MLSRRYADRTGWSDRFAARAARSRARFDLGVNGTMLLGVSVPSPTIVRT
jgi:hypothetical protein